MLRKVEIVHLQHLLKNDDHHTASEQVTDPGHLEDNIGIDDSTDEETQNNNDKLDQQRSNLVHGVEPSLALALNLPHNVRKHVSCVEIDSGVDQNKDGQPRDLAKVGPGDGPGDAASCFDPLIQLFGEHAVVLFDQIGTGEVEVVLLEEVSFELLLSPEVFVDPEEEGS